MRLFCKNNLHTYVIYVYNPVLLLNVILLPKLLIMGEIFFQVIRRQSQNDKVKKKTQNIFRINLIAKEFTTGICNIYALIGVETNSFFENLSKHAHQEIYT